MGHKVSAHVKIISPAKKLELISLEGTVYEIIWYEGIDLNVGITTAFMDMKSSSQIASAMTAVVFAARSLIEQRVTHILDQMRSVFGLIKIYTLFQGNIVAYSVQFPALDPTSPSPQLLLIPLIHQTFSLGSEGNFDFYVPDSSVQGNIDHKVNQREYWSYLPNYSLPIQPLSPRDHCDKKHRGPSTTRGNLQLMVNELYSIIHQAHSGLLTPNEAAIRTRATWDKFEIYEQKHDKYRTKEAEFTPRNCLIAMRVIYNTGKKDTLVACSIINVPSLQDESRHQGIILNVSSVPLKRKPSSNNNFQSIRSVIQFDETTAVC